MSHFELVGEFHRVFDYPVRKTPYLDVFDKDQKLLSSRVAFLREERDEFLEHFETKNIPELADALCDLLYFAYGTGQCLGIDIDRLLEENNITTVRLDFSPDDKVLDENKKDFSINCDAIIKKLDTVSSFIDMFEKSCSERNFTGMEENLLDIIQKTYDLGYFMYFDMDPMFREVHRSNMTKVCLTEEDAMESLNKYKESGIYKQPVIRIKEPYFMVYDDHLNKILKSFKWEVPDLQKLIKYQITIV